MAADDNTVPDHLDPDLRVVLAELAADGNGPLHRLPVTEARASVEALARLNGPVAEMAEVRELAIPGGADGVTLTARLYRPEAARAGGPACLFFHGGGWMLGSVAFADGPVRDLAAAAGLVVVSCSYRLTPEHVYPAAIDDARAAFAWVVAHAAELDVDPARIAVAGESAGGNLAAAVALACRGEQVAPAHQLPLFAPLDTDDTTESHRRYGKNYMLEAEDMRYFWRVYLGDGLADPPALAAPLRAPELAGVAPATVVVAECDPLRDDGLRYVERLRAAGVPVRPIVWERLTHGAFQMTGRVPRVATLITELGETLRRALDRA